MYNIIKANYCKLLLTIFNWKIKAASKKLYICVVNFCEMLGSLIQILKNFTKKRCIMNK